MKKLRHRNPMYTDMGCASTYSDPSSTWPI